LLVLEVLKDDELATPSSLPDVLPDRNALILYTSGTTSKPKGVVTTHAQIEAQISTLVQAWEWSGKDHTLCVLPLHHVHGIINVIGCSLWVGAICAFLPHFSAEGIIQWFREGRLNVFMAVPTIYFKLIAHYETLDEGEQQSLTEAMRLFRLMVCGSAALPVTVMEKWERISGQRLLERYGMTELGMAISNPYRGERRAGYVGMPLPSVQVRLVDDAGKEVENGQPGEIQVKGPNVFKEYWGRSAATMESFTADGWFKTGDVAVVEHGYYRIMGRSSVDIIKSGGYKISALEIEEVLRTHVWVDDCAVVGIDDDEWGELIVAALVPTPAGTEQFNEQELNAWLMQRIAGYKKPRRYLLVTELPRNAMGKVVKNEVKKLFSSST
jgi:malonyl-CoA/methylmalonyl-CoA synthetase